MSEESVFPAPVIVPLDELREKLCLLTRKTLDEMLAVQGLRVVSSEALVIAPGNGRQTREALHKAFDALVAMYIGASPLGTSLRGTSVMDLIEWSHANLDAGAGGQ